MSAPSLSTRLVDGNVGQLKIHVDKEEILTEI